MTVEVTCKHCKSTIKKVTIDKDQILEAVCEVYGFSKEQMVKKSRKRYLVEARFVVTYFIHKFHGKVLTYNQISQVIGKNDHTYVCYALNKSNDWSKHDEDLRNRIEFIENILVTYKESD